MEDTLREIKQSYENKGICKVLILVLMEDTLREDRCTLALSVSES